VSWATRVVNPYNGATNHVVFFDPAADRSGPCPVVRLEIPEARRPTIRGAFKEAQQRRARLIIVCDTTEQADAIAASATASLPHHRRVALERALEGGWDTS
jgi:hypothetical protein